MINGKWLTGLVLAVSCLDKGILMLIQEVSAGTLKPGTRTLDLKAGGVGLAPLDSPRIPVSVRQKIQDLHRQLIEKKLQTKEYPGQ